MFEGVKVTAFDADDTLWENESLFRKAEKEWAAVMAEYGTLEELSRQLYATEEKNMAELGYGAKAYIISVLETSIKIAGDALTGSMIGQIIASGRKIITNPAVPYSGVEETLAAIRESGRYKMVLYTKGDLLDQKSKASRSGLLKYFDRVEVVESKDEAACLSLCADLGISPSELVMVGNSFKSDIIPALSVGGWGIHIPSDVIWEHEKAEEFAHPRLLRLESFSEVASALL